MIVAEESPHPTTGLTAGRVWYVDPIDGTREFIAKSGEFSVMIGLAVEGRSRLGVVYRPDRDLLFGGIADQEAWVIEGRLRRPLSVSNRTDPGSLCLAVSRSHRHPRMDAIREKMGIRQEMRCGSVGLKIALIATGEADLYIEPGPYTSAWDACGPEAIVTGAGGRFTDLLGSPLLYGSGDLKNRRGLVATNGACHDRAIAAIAPIAREIL
jgi:3'(2'), 5'-bisphosphate nucleotidase